MTREGRIKDCCLKSKVVLFKLLLLLVILQIKTMYRKVTCDILGLVGIVLAGAGLVLAYLEYTNQCTCA